MSPDDMAKLFEAYNAGGWMLAASSGLTIGIAFLRRADVQAALVGLHPRAAWDTWPRWARILVTVLAGVVAAMLAAPSQGVSVWAALAGAVPTVLLAMGTHELRQSAGKAAAELREPPSPGGWTPRPPIVRSASITTRLPDADATRPPAPPAKFAPVQRIVIVSADRPEWS